MLSICLTSVIDSRTECTDDLESLLEKIAMSSDMQALSDLYNNTSAAVYAFALSILKNTHDAEDVLHDCYLKVFSAAPAYRSHGRAMAWIMVIVRNLCLHKLRDRKKQAESPIEDWEDYFEVQEAVSVEDKLVLWECMTRLTEEERQIITLYAVNGFKHREIAQVLDIPLPTVLSKYHRALKKLEKNL